jgi:hypothetical protein
MSVVYAQTLKKTRMEAVEAALDAGSGAADIQIATSGGFGSATDILVTIEFNDPASTVVSDVLTFSGLPVFELADFTGTASQARIRDSDGNVVISGLTVGTSGTNIILNTTSIEAGQLVRIDSGTITHG